MIYNEIDKLLRIYKIMYCFLIYFLVEIKQITFYFYQSLKLYSNNNE